METAGGKAEQPTGNKSKKEQLKAHEECKCIASLVHGKDQMIFFLFWSSGYIPAPCRLPCLESGALATPNAQKEKRSLLVLFSTFSMSLSYCQTFCFGTEYSCVNADIRKFGVVCYAKECRIACGER